MKKLNPNAQKWVDALRSGKYKQAREVLKRGNRFCCLGVLCEVAMENGVAIKRSRNLYDNNKTHLPPVAREWVNLCDLYGALDAAKEWDTEDDIPESLAVANDNGMSFNEIADLIELHAEALGVSA